MSNQLTNTSRKIQIIAVAFALLFASSFIGFTQVHGYGGNGGHGQGEQGDNGHGHNGQGNGQGNGNGNGHGNGNGNNGNGLGNGGPKVSAHMPNFGSFFASILSFFHRA